ncbi:MAG: sigma-54-dependent Fis family transcriptional regulator [Desulfobacterales bacterium]|uniref:Sigma-54-dependent Fis family transcriptional regulator n=2 Tax=Desulfobacterales TaxID=213118 RepID=A0A8J6NYG8_9BACT|nr:sigma-54-dependent Fis family transcriptional regulator [Candidatus Desulfatibia vada]
MPKILVIDDNPDILKLIVDILKSNDYEVTAAPGGEAGIRALESYDYDLVLTDLIMPDIDGIDVLDHLIAKSTKTMCIILTGHGSIKSSVEAIKKGAFDYITKPVSTIDILLSVEKALKFKSLEEENTRLKKELRGQYKYTNFVGTSRAIKQIFDLIEKVADTDGTVLITGASGTGKELIARALHYNSCRCDKPLVVVNCGAVPEALLESELFGHEKGAFTGAHKRRIGRFELANCGTIFLDEIGEMSPALQVKLLRVLQEQKFERLGGTKTIHVDLRIVAATNKNLTTAINKEKFREDLYYRLNVIPIKVPNLKQRKSDIPILIDHFLKKFQKGKNKKITNFSPEVMDAMHAYDWPGNVRELENVIKRFTILCENPVVTFDDLPDSIRESSKSVQPVEEVILEKDLNLNEAVQSYEKRIIIEALEKSNWVKSKAAKLLNINRTTLVAKIKKQNLDDVASA